MGGDTVSALVDTACYYPNGIGIHRTTATQTQGKDLGTPCDGTIHCKTKILHTLHSFVALCIKIKDRTAVAPSRHDIESKLVPFADVIRARTSNANGMSLDEFNNELHFWILEPVSGLIMSTDEQKQWMDEIDQLRDELVRAQKDKMRIQRKSQMDLTVLLDKMKGFDIENNESEKK